MNFKIYFLIVSTLFFISCSTQKNEYLLNEEFHNNTLGWAEEKTDFHHTELIDGKLLILSEDTTTSRISSNGPRDHSFMWKLPKSFQFSTSMEFIDGGRDASFGFLLYSASIQYKFSISKEGKVNVTEYDYNREKETNLVNKEISKSDIDYHKPAILRADVTSSSFKFYINNALIGEGKVKAKSWETVRLFASAGGTGVKADYYRFKSL